MPDFREVAKMPVADMIDAKEDEPSTVDHLAPLREAAQKVRAHPSHMVLVVADGKVVGVLNQADLAQAVADGKGPDTPCREAIQNKPGPVTVTDEVSLEDIANLPESLSVVVVTNAAGEPKATLKRQDLADRIRRLA